MTLRAGVLGAGYFAQFHHKAWRRLDGVDLVAIADRDTGKAGVTHRSVEALLDAGVDVLDICVPPEGHAGAIRAGLAAGVRAIVCQKPFCGGLRDAREMVAEAESAGIPLVVHENFRFQPWWRAIRRAVDDGAVGTPYGATFRLRMGDGQGPDAYMARRPHYRTMPRFLIHETGVHYIDVFRFLLGDPLAVYADLRRLNSGITGEDAGILVLDHPGGARSVLDGTRLVDHDAEDMRMTFGTGIVDGSDGVLSLEGDGWVCMRRVEARRKECLRAAERLPGFAGDCVFALQAKVVAHLLEGAPLENAARDYLGVMAVVDAAYRSDAERRKVAV